MFTKTFLYIFLESGDVAAGVVDEVCTDGHRHKSHRLSVVNYTPCCYFYILYSFLNLPTTTTTTVNKILECEDLILKYGKQLLWDFIIHNNPLAVETLFNSKIMSKILKYPFKINLQQSMTKRQERELHECVLENMNTLLIRPFYKKNSLRFVEGSVFHMIVLLNNIEIMQKYIDEYFEYEYCSLGQMLNSTNVYAMTARQFFSIHKLRYEFMNNYLYKTPLSCNYWITIAQSQSWYDFSKNDYDDNNDISFLWSLHSLRKSFFTDDFNKQIIDLNNNDSDLVNDINEDLKNLWHSNFNFISGKRFNNVLKMLCVFPWYSEIYNLLHNYRDWQSKFVVILEMWLSVLKSYILKIFQEIDDKSRLEYYKSISDLYISFLDFVPERCPNIQYILELKIIRHLICPFFEFFVCEAEKYQEIVEYKYDTTKTDCFDVCLKCLYTHHRELYEHSFLLFRSVIRYICTNKKFNKTFLLYLSDSKTMFIPVYLLMKTVANDIAPLTNHCDTLSVYYNNRVNMRKNLVKKILFYHAAQKIGILNQLPILAIEKIIHFISEHKDLNNFIYSINNADCILKQKQNVT